MRITDAINESILTKQRILADNKLIEVIHDVADTCCEAFCDGNKVLFCGNGGSAADAQHLAAEFSGRFSYDREPLPSEALHVNSSYLTAVANDYSFEEVYSRILKGLEMKAIYLLHLYIREFKNIIRALETAREMGSSPLV